MAHGHSLRVEVAHRGDVLSERQIWVRPEPAFNVAHVDREILVEDGKLALNLVPEARFPLDGLPPNFLNTLT